MERKKRIFFLHFAYCVELSLNTICISMHYYNNEKKAMNEERTGKWLMNCELCMLNCNAQNIIHFLQRIQTKHLGMNFLLLLFCRMYILYLKKVIILSKSRAFL